MDKKILIIKKNNQDVFLKGIGGIEKYYGCSLKNIFLKIFLKFKLPCISIFFGKWKKNIKKYDIIILFDNGFNKKILDYIKRKNKNAKIIFWYWNSLNEYNNEVIKNENIDEIWTYNRFDAEKYNLKYNPQFYHISANIDKNEIKNDVIFMGRNKGREKSIEKVEKQLKQYGLKCNFNIINDEKNYIKYEDYLKDVEKSKCIFDFNNVEYCGLSLRPLEALFFEKKLITNNKDIINYDFYRKENIFVLGLDKIENIKEFINGEYKEIDKEIIKYYDFESWLNRFLVEV